MTSAPAIVTGYGPRLTVDLGAIQRNWQALDKVSAGALTGAAVKADGYGLGAVPVAKALYVAGTRFFFVATPDEGLALRPALPEAHIFVLNGLFPGAAPLYVGERLMPVLNSLPMLEEWLVACLGRNEALPAALHFDTGMNRLGFRLNETSIVKRMIEDVGYAPQMIMSHLACADQPQHEKNRTQLALFSSVINQFPGIPASLANSAATMTSREMHFQMVRPGIALYGGRAVNGRKNPMVPAVTLEAPVIQIRECKTGESVGYGASYILPRDTRLAIIALGYADGFIRAASSTNQHAGGRVHLRGTLCPLIGRVSMDMFAIDITDLGNDIPIPGEMVEVLGPNVSVDDQADPAGTIGYEILTSLKGRYPRTYVSAAEQPAA
ncbi:MAG: alanine racemase [Devosia sp.]|uniref:alanine racemase n=1 Tax=Devosia sp. 66-22 TaxID=1895753 RepID=UPI0009295D17|nr:alanine racemase [Devosia sp. 66-22]MBN9347579.1 alanine racemase [Devosia sp.]OJX51571.1 MAG: alanine racemase [Devosia sp. 66-22]